MEYREFRTIWFAVSCHLMQSGIPNLLCREHRNAMIDVLTDDGICLAVYGYLVGEGRIPVPGSAEPGLVPATPLPAPSPENKP